MGWDDEVAMGGGIVGRHSFNDTLAFYTHPLNGSKRLTAVVSCFGHAFSSLSTTCNKHLELHTNTCTTMLLAVRR
jgi:hypothetical protein